ncbi:zinc ribbon domain-containing protein [Paenibacillus sp. strain BS8-2]
MGIDKVTAVKKCPYCAEENQDEAIKCKHCGSMVTKSPSSPSTPPIRTDLGQRVIKGQRWAVGCIVIPVCVIFIGIIIFLATR